jgi:hypothetical protein
MPNGVFKILELKICAEELFIGDIRIISNLEYTQNLFY